MYENASKIALKATCGKFQKWLTSCLHCIMSMSLGSWRSFRAILANITFWRFALQMNVIKEANHDKFLEDFLKM